MSARVGRPDTRCTMEDAGVPGVPHFAIVVWHCARVVLCLALVLGHATAANARDFLWKVTGKTGSVYLMGSIHLLTQDFYPLSAAVDPLSSCRASVCAWMVCASTGFDQSIASASTARTNHRPAFVDTNIFRDLVLM